MNYDYFVPSPKSAVTANTMAEHTESRAEPPVEALAEELADLTIHTVADAMHDLEQIESYTRMLGRRCEVLRATLTCLIKPL